MGGNSQVQEISKKLSGSAVRSGTQTERRTQKRRKSTPKNSSSAPRRTTSSATQRRRSVTTPGTMFLANLREVERIKTSEDFQVRSSVTIWAGSASRLGSTEGEASSKQPT